MATTSSSSFVEIRDGVSLETRQYGDATGSKALVVWGHGLCNSLEGEDEDMLWDFWEKKTVGEGDIDGPSSTDDDARRRRTGGADGAITRVVARASPAKVSSQNRKKRPVSR